MRIDIFLPTQYITSSGALANLSVNSIEKAESYLVNLILNFEGGITRSKAEGYYKSSRGFITKSKYIILTVYTNNNDLYNILFNSNHISLLCKELNQESIGVVVNNQFYCIK